MWGAVDVMPASKAQPHSAMLKHCLHTVFTLYDSIWYSIWYEIHKVLYHNMIYDIYMFIENIIL